MGQTLVRLIAEDERLTLVGALEHAKSPALNEDAGKLAGLDALGVAVTDNALNVMKMRMALSISLTPLPAQLCPLLLHKQELYTSLARRDLLPIKRPK